MILSEEPEIIILQEPSDDQQKTVLELGDEEIPKQIKMAKSTVRALDNIVKDIYHVPKKYRNHWLDLGYDEPLKILWNTDGHPYIMAPTKMKPVQVIKVMVKEKGAEDILDLLLTAKDFCDYCEMPLDPRHHESEWLGYASGGGSIADVIDCQFCEMENIRWEADFLKGHPALGELATR